MQNKGSARLISRPRYPDGIEPSADPIVLRRPWQGWHLRQVSLIQAELGQTRFILGSKHTVPVSSNVLARQFQKPLPHQAWVSDMTYLRIRRGTQ